MLGLSVDLSNYGTSGSFEIGHTPERRSELAETITIILGEGVLDAKGAERLRGRMIFFEGFAFGRIANAAVRSLGKLCTNVASKNELDESMKRALQILRDRVLLAKPLCIDGKLCDTWFVYSDGAFDSDRRSRSIGGVLVDPHGRAIEFLGYNIDNTTLDLFMAVSKHPIHKLEVLLTLGEPFCWFASGVLYGQ